MYPEFIAIYIALGVIALLLIAAIVLLIILLARSSRGGGHSVAPNQYMGGSHPVANQYPNSTPNPMVYCKRCGSQFQAAQRICPKCGTPR